MFLFIVNFTNGEPDLIHPLASLDFLKIVTETLPY
jgi:hypothetical protein